MNRDTLLWGQFHQLFWKASSTHADPKSVKKTDSLTVFFELLGSAPIKVQCWWNQILVEKHWILCRHSNESRCYLSRCKLLCSSHSLHSKEREIQRKGLKKEVLHFLSKLENVTGRNLAKARCKEEKDLAAQISPHPLSVSSEVREALSFGFPPPTIAFSWDWRLRGRLSAFGEALELTVLSVSRNF